jgi:hypothetical protein
MSNFDEKVVDRIKRLEREVERLRVKESPGAWLDWTPTVAFNNTAPTTSITYARYAKVGKIVHVQALIAVTKGSSNSTQFSITMPVAIVRSGLSILYWETIWQTEKTIRVGYGYASTSSFLYSKGTTIAQDGEIGFNYTYEAA